MAEVVRAVPDTFALAYLTDLDGLKHAVPRYSIAVLKANGSEQLKNTAQSIQLSESKLFVVAFSTTGQKLNNEFDVYSQTIVNSTTNEVALVGIAVSGEDMAVRRVTKKFSMM